MKPEVRFVLWPSLVVTVTVFAPAVLAPVVQVALVVEETTTGLHETPPIDTVMPDLKALPVKVTAVPPPNGPAEGDTAESAGPMVAPVSSLGACTSPTTQPVVTKTMNRRSKFNLLINLESFGT